MDKYIYPYFDKHRKIVLENLEHSRQADNIEAIHDLRTSFKRIRVIIRFAETLSKGRIDASFILRQFKVLYNTSGRVRDIQVHRQLLNDYEQLLSTSFPEYQIYLERQERKAQKKYLNVSLEYNPFFLNSLDDILRNRLKHVRERSVIVCANRMVEAHVKSIRYLFYDFNEKIRFHNIRRHLKNIGYLNNMLSGAIEVDEYLNISRDRLNELGTILGEWHDKVNAVGFLERYRQSKIKVNLLLGKVLEDKYHDEVRIHQILKEEIKL